VIVASIDPTDTPADAAAARQKFVAQLGGNVPAGSMHFLIGQQPEITTLANAIGFHYVRVPGPDGKMTQFAHSSVIMVATPEGKLSKYLTGVEYQPRDLRLALLEASDHRIGSATDLILLYCCSYSPTEGRYTVSVLRVLGLAGMATVFGLALMLYLLARKPKVKTAA
jgi:protein SCO1/2